MKRYALFTGLVMLIYACGANATEEPTGNTTLQATCDDSAARDKIKEAVSVATVFEMTDEEAETWLATPDEERPLHGFHSYAVDTTYDNNCMLSLTVTYEGMGAYPSTGHNYYTFDMHTGEQIGIYDIVDSNKSEGLKRIFAERLEQNIITGREDLPEDEISLEDYDYQIESYREFYPEAEPDDYYITPAGIVFISHLWFPHVIQALQPDNKVRMSFEELRPFLKDESMFQ